MNTNCGRGGGAVKKFGYLREGMVGIFYADAGQVRVNVQPFLKKDRGGVGLFHKRDIFFQEKKRERSFPCFLEPGDSRNL
jgi:hypothetical protein